MANRRQFLRTLLGASSAAGGGLLLPWRGTGALSLDLETAANVPASVVPLPFSSDCLELREIKAELLHSHLNPDGRTGRDSRWYELMTTRYAPTARRLAHRPVHTWADCVELAETIWTFMPKESVDHAPSNRLSTGEGNTMFGSRAYQCREALVALVEGVLTLGGGDRFDPSTGVHHG